MIKIAICDDELTFLDYLHRYISKEFKQQGVEFRIDKFTSGREFLDAYKAGSFDVVFLDIRLPDINGFDIAAEIRNLSEKVYIIFITTEDMLVYDSFCFQPFDFIPKTLPSVKIDSGSKDAFLKRHIHSTVERLTPRFALNRQICLDLPHGRKVFISLLKIRLIKSTGNYVEYSIAGREAVKLRKKLDDVEAELDNRIFLRVHKSYIINLKFVKSISFSKLTAIMDDDTLITISKSHKKQAETAYVKYFRDFGGSI